MPNGDYHYSQAELRMMELEKVEQMLMEVMQEAEAGGTVRALPAKAQVWWEKYKKRNQEVREQAKREKEQKAKVLRQDAERMLREAERLDG